jgi:hypothetical protein
LRIFYRQLLFDALSTSHGLTDIHQCAIPVFDGLFPEPHNTSVLRLLFICAHWHGLAKLRMHTDRTLDIFDETTVRIGAEFRAFTDKTCSAFDTRELRREMDARKRRNLKKAQLNSAAKGSVANRSRTDPQTKESRDEGPRRRKFNLRTFKYHSLGDYPSMIRQFGTSDSFSTEPVKNKSIFCRRLALMYIFAG